MGLKVYVDLLSQPSRALVLFLRQNKIPHELKLISIFKGEHRTPEFVENVHPFGKVPAIDDNGFKLIESIAILRYLSRKYDVPDHWYPKDIKLQGKVDEFLEWQHIGARTPYSMYFMTVFLKPMLSGKPPEERHVSLWKSRMETSLNEMNDIWLKSSPYLGGDKISIADLIGLCEVDQPRMAKYNPAEGRPKLSAWIDRVRRELQPHYDEVTASLNRIAEQSKL